MMRLLCEVEFIQTFEGRSVEALGLLEYARAVILDNVTE